MQISFRVQEWLAEHTRWVQYPQVRRVAKREPRRWLWPMPWAMRAGVAGVFLLLVVVLGFVTASALYVAVLMFAM